MNLVNALDSTARAQRPRRRPQATRRAPLSIAAALIVICAVLGTVPLCAQELPDVSRTPFLLVANPDMPDPTFQQTVILILPPSDPPLVAGLIVNKPTKVTLGQLFSHSAPVVNRAQPVYFGGPVDLTSPVILMRTARASSATTRLFEDVYMSDNDTAVRNFLARPQSDKDVRLYLGRAQWTVGQLHAEILSGSWVVAPATPDLVFSTDPAALWQKLVDQSKLRQIEWNPAGVRTRTGGKINLLPPVRCDLRNCSN
jgi:putative transcriptional regulator